MAMVRGPPSIAVSGSKPIRFIIAIMRLAEAAAWLDRNQNMMAMVTLTMIMATLI
jgi:hypothetical protein